MNAIAFDTDAFVKRLVAVGMPEPQAEVLADGQRCLIDDRLATKDDLASLDAATKTEIARLETVTKAEIARLETVTKADITRLETSTKTDIARLEGITKTEIARLEGATKTESARLEGSLKRDISDTKADILKWVVGTIGFQAIVILGAVLALSRFGH